jgi:RNA polymerase sigma-70 factor (ECF subfamily)
MTSDEDLMLQFQNGSREAFEELFARYRQPLYSFFRRRLSNAARADDLMQETFLAVIRAKVRYEPRALVRTYLYGIALKLVSAERRWQSRRPAAPLVDRAANPPPGDAAIWIGQALVKLDEMDREILMLREYEELSYAEIAKLLHLGLNTVRSRLFRARLALKNLLAGDLCP